MANKITVLLDLVTDKAQSAAKGFRSSIADAEGGLNKFKAGASSVFASVQANAVALALGAGTAIAAFGAKSVATFQETALAAGKFSDATGLAVEDASRLQEVAKDLGISTEALSSDFKFLQKSIASNSEEVKQLAIETQRTKDGQVDVNATFLEAIDKLGGVKDANQRALIASKLFGRGFADSAELILGNADEIKKRLADVSEAQVISPAQVERARKFRDQMDELSDNLKGVEIVVGDALIPVLGNLADVLGTVETGAIHAADAIDKIPGGTDFLKKLFSGPQDVADEFLKHLRDLEEGLGFPKRVDIGPLRDQFNQIVAAGNSANDVIDAQGNVVQDLGARWSAASIPLEAASGAMAEMQSHTDELASGLDDVGSAAKDAGSDFNVFEDGLQKSADIVDFVTGKIDALRGMLDLTGQLDDINQGFADVAEAAKDATDPEGARKYRDEVRRLQGQLLDLVQSPQFKDLSEDKRVKIIAEIAQGNLESMNAALDDLTKDRFINLNLIAPKLAGFDSANGTFTPGAAPAAATFKGVSTPVPVPVGSVDQRTIINNFPVGTTPTTQYIDATINQRRNGSR